ncbi:hypothetical protein [Streptomyces olivochromogenes]|uniref:hypothetical protein n=1 Tax=Streptomyces olivochromogenes TaxID=1963 RepID=UPI001F38A3D7|nr:hypothetical protein [Streptomyces olivochromogenes]MCF3131479.1 hypothetical protein [Streptomyces olivochromogenes]
MRFRERIEDVRSVLVMADIAGAWTWRVQLDGRDVAMAGRAYQRHRECQYNLNQFLAAVPVAQLSDGLVSRPRLRGLHLPGPGSAPSEGPGDGDDPPRSTTRVRIQAGAGAS